MYCWRLRGAWGGVRSNQSNPPRYGPDYMHYSFILLHIPIKLLSIS